MSQIGLKCAEAYISIALGISSLMQAASYCRFVAFIRCRRCVKFTWIRFLEQFILWNGLFLSLQYIYIELYIVGTDVDSYLCIPWRRLKDMVPRVTTIWRAKDHAHSHNYIELSRGILDTLGLSCILTSDQVIATLDRYSSQLFFT